MTTVICVLDVIERFQTLIGGALALIGVLWVIRHERQLAIDQASAEAREAAENLRRALIEELTVMTGILKASGELFSEEKTQEYPYSLMPILEGTSIYDASVADLGRLSGTEISAVVKAYMLVKELPARVLLLSPAHEAKDPLARYIPVEREYYPVVAQLCEGFATRVDEAIAALQKGGLG